MYSALPSFILGFHGCDRKIGEAILEGKKKPTFSENDYDWLGNGIYFWENNPDRAMSYAQMLSTKKGRSKGKINDPFVIGAIIDPGKCLNLTDENALLQLQPAYAALKRNFELAETPLPENEEGFKGDTDRIKRRLDCRVTKQCAPHFLKATLFMLVPVFRKKRTYKSPFGKSVALKVTSGL